MTNIVKKETNVKGNLIAPDIKNLEKFIEIEKKRRELLKKYISENLVEGVDYGKIKITSSKTGQEYESKPTLFKAGSEKFMSLMHLRVTFKRDDETWEMSGKKPGLFCYVCFLLDSKGNVVGEGRGSCDVQEKRSANEAIKLAEKRAQLDAVLRTGGLSDFFTQDLEDLPEAKVIKPIQPATARQITLIYELLPNRGKTTEDVCKAYKVSKIEDLNIKQASAVISRLEKMPPVKAEKIIEAKNKIEEEIKEQEKLENEEKIDIDEAIREIDKKFKS